MWMLSVSRFIGGTVSWFYSCTPCILFLVDPLYFDVCVGRPVSWCLFMGGPLHWCFVGRPVYLMVCRTPCILMFCGTPCMLMFVLGGSVHWCFVARPVSWCFIDNSYPESNAKLVYYNEHILYRFNVGYRPPPSILKLDLSVHYFVDFNWRDII